jgi:hypothetical protein
MSLLIAVNVQDSAVQLHSTGLQFSLLDFIESLLSAYFVVVCCRPGMRTIDPARFGCANALEAVTKRGR